MKKSLGLSHQATGAIPQNATGGAVPQWALGQQNPTSPFGQPTQFAQNNTQANDGNIYLLVIP